MRVRYGDLIINCDFAFCDGNYIIFGINSKELFKTYYDHCSEARFKLKQLLKDGYLFVNNLKESDRRIGCVADIVDYMTLDFHLADEECED